MPGRRYPATALAFCVLGSLFAYAVIGTVRTWAGGGGDSTPSGYALNAVLFGLPALACFALAVRFARRRR